MSFEYTALKKLEFMYVFGIGPTVSTLCKWAIPLAPILLQALQEKTKTNKQEGVPNHLWILPGFVAFCLGSHTTGILYMLRWPKSSGEWALTWEANLPLTAPKESPTKMLLVVKQCPSNSMWDSQHALLYFPLSPSPTFFFLFLSNYIFQDQEPHKLAASSAHKKKLQESEFLYLSRKQGRSFSDNSRKDLR